MVKVEWEENNWICFTEGDPIDSSINLNILNEYSKKIKMIIEYDLGEISRSHSSQESEIIIDEILKEFLVENILIPYNFEERKLKFSSAFNKLNINVENADEYQERNK